jgi:transposase
MMIWAMDLGSSQSAICTLDTTTGKVRHGSCRTQAARIRALLQRQRPDLVVVEISPLAALVHDLAVDLGLAIQVADTTQDAWRWWNVKRKTDRDDALKLARLAALGQINPVHIPEPRMRQWREGPAEDRHCGGDAAIVGGGLGHAAGPSAVPPGAARAGRLIGRRGRRTEA